MSNLIRLNKGTSFIADTFFVYGTLMPLGDHSKLYEHAQIVSQTCIELQGLKAIDGGIPFAWYTGNPEDSLIGELITFNADLLNLYELNYVYDKYESIPILYEPYMLLWDNQQIKLYLSFERPGKSIKRWGEHYITQPKNKIECTLR